MSPEILAVISAAAGGLIVLWVDRRRYGKTKLKLPKPTGKQLRDATLFIGGLLGVAHETLLRAEAREMLLIVFAAMMGLPAFLRLDERKAEEADDEKQ